MGQDRATPAPWASWRSRALDDLCALAVAATGAEIAVMTELAEGRHVVIGRHGTRAEAFPSLLPKALDWEGVVALEPSGEEAALLPALADGSLDRVGAVLVLPLRRGGVAVGVVLLAARGAVFTQADRAVLYHLRHLAEAQMEAEAALMQVAARAFERIEAARG